MLLQKEQQWIEKHPVLHQGNIVTVRTVVIDEKSQFTDYWNGLKDSEKIKIAAILSILDNKKGNFANETKFKKFEDYSDATFYEIKSHQVRIGCVWEKNYNLMLLFGTTKKQDKWKNGDVKQLKHIYDGYAAKKAAFLREGA